MDREEILQKKLETLEELEKIGKTEKAEEDSDIMSLYIPKPQRAELESAMARLRKLVCPF